MGVDRYKDTDVWPDNWKEWIVSILLVTITLVSLTAALMTGAFSALTADRTATVSTTGDADALLALQPENEAYARLEEGTLEVAIDGSFGTETDGEGVNPDALTQIEDVFRITNRGSFEVAVWITTSGRHTGTVVFYDDGPHEDSRTAIDHPRNAHVLNPGEDLVVSMDIDTRGLSVARSEELIDDITIHARDANSG
jgi:hypothetical protein